ncbi:chemotaxis protein [Paraferrimonas sp. SM1919]|uniref:chemotaxis protein n=1 Tax=Paraferrimonas sp. SM1919 TaxID=2662263 RepID=UPI0013CF59A3|nr:chemotaxis protein [Paraferrimonas sp. SM1919]
MNFITSIIADPITFTFLIILFAIFSILTVKDYLSRKALEKNTTNLIELLKQKEPLAVQNYSDGSIKSWVFDSLNLRNSRPVIRDNKWLTNKPLQQLTLTYDFNRYKLGPALLTSFGVTGTFLGITLGLKDFDTAGNSQALIDSANLLLVGMKTAFVTSLVGIALSAVFMLLNKLNASQVIKAQNKLQACIYDNCIEETAVHYLRHIASQDNQAEVEQQQQFTSAITSLSDKLGSVTEHFETMAESFNGDKLVSGIAAAFDKGLEEKLSPALTSIAEEIKTLKEVKEQNQQELAQLLVTQIKEQIVEPLTTKMEETTKAVANSNEATTRLNENVEEIIKATAETTQTIAKFQDNTLEKLKDFAESLSKTLASFKDDTKGAMAEMSGEVKAMLQTATEGMEEQRQAFEQSAQTASQAFTNISGKMEESLDKRTKAEKELLESVATRIGTLLEESKKIFEGQSTAIKAVGKEAAELMGTAKTELQQGLGDIDTKVVNMSQTVQKELEAFRIQYQQKLSEYFEKQNEILEQSLSNQKDGLNEVVNNFKQVFKDEYKTRLKLLKDLTEQYSKLQQSADAITRLAEAVGLNSAAKMKELQAVSESLSKQVSYLQKEYKAASGEFKTLTQQLPAEMDKYFTRANKSVEKFFNVFDKEAAAIHKQLHEAAQFLVMAETTRQQLSETKAS